MSDVDRGPGHMVHEGTEVAICVAVITQAIQDIHRARVGSHEFRTAVEFFRSRQSNWSWMQNALQEIEPHVVEAQVERIIGEREAGVRIELRTHRRAPRRAARLREVELWDEEDAELDVWQRGERRRPGEQEIRDARLS